LEHIALQTDLFFFAGVHHLTRGLAEDASRAAADLARCLARMKAAHPALLCHAQYVVPKVPEHEAIVLRALVGVLDSLALNSVEVPMLVGALERGGLLTSSSWAAGISAEVESAPTMLAGALAIKEALRLKRVHVHGLGGDLVISAPGMPGEKNPERQRLALLKARQLASNKAANDSGEIKTQEDIWPLVPTVRGTALAELHRIADALCERGDIDETDRARVVEHWWFRLPRIGEVLHYVPSRGIHDHTGGTVSLGDTIDSVALIYALEPAAP
jgi:ADP-dependent phosphofructokinase/glucokinase